jgi:hypothetical protein
MGQSEFLSDIGKIFGNETIQHMAPFRFSERLRDVFLIGLQILDERCYGAGELHVRQARYARLLTLRREVLGIILSPEVMHCPLFGE